MFSKIRNARLRLLSMVLVLVFLVLMIPFAALLQQPKVSAASASSDYCINPDGTRRVGCWWWHESDGTNAGTRKMYLDFLEAYGVTEIYYYAYGSFRNSGGRSSIHTFVQDAMAHNMRVSILYDDAGSLSSSTMNGFANAFTSYKNEYSQDALYGMHFDIENGNYTTSGLTSYCNNFIKNLDILNNVGCETEVDVPCGWQLNGENIEMDGVKGIYDIIAAHITTMTLMSYRDTADGIWGLAYQPVQGCLHQNCNVLFGVECGNSFEGDQVDFSGESLQYLTEQLEKLYTKVGRKNLTVPYGIAIHQARTVYQLPKQDPIVVPMTGTTLYENKEVNLSYSSREHFYIYTNEELANALHDDWVENGAIEDVGGYYQITISAKTSSAGNYIYPCLWDSTNQFDLWPNSNDDYPKGTSIGTSMKTISSLVKKTYYAKGSKFAEFNGAEDGLYIYLEEIANLDLYSVKVEVYRPSTETTTQPVPVTTTQPATSDEPTSSDDPTTSDISDISEDESNDITTTTAHREFIYGDVNSDKSIDMKDVLLLRKIVAYITDEGDWDAADCSTDYFVDMKDVLVLRKYIAGMDVKLGPQ